MVDEMYQVFKKNIPRYDKVCIPLSGGLDSRVIAGLVRESQKIDLAFTQFELRYPIKIERGISNVDYARQIAQVVGAPFYAINVNQDSPEDRRAIKDLPDAHILKKSKMFTGLRKLNEFVDTHDYTFVLGHGLDSLTGVGVTPIHNYKKHDEQTRIKKLKYFGGIFQGTYGEFGKWDCPLWSDEVEEFCLSLPLKYRFMQRLYRKMISKYFPDLAKINREDMHCPINVSEPTYFISRTAYFFKKSLRQRA